jgi:3-deoxy-D-manno-octulosonic-acid transferase
LIIIYNILILFYSLILRIASLWNTKARKWVKGRRNLFREVEKKIAPDDKIIWIHCSSTGEFEQGKPIIDSLIKNYPSYKILVTFFSPSGYESKSQSKDYIISYLPVDTKENAKRFISLVNPSLVIFVKYEFWYHHLNTANFKHIPILLISAVFRPDQFFFIKWGRFYFNMLFLFRHIFVQDKASFELLKQRDIQHVSIGGDTRFDRVAEIQNSSYSFPLIEDFIDEKPVIIAGSTWTGDEEVLAPVVNNLTTVKLIIAPHEINEEHIRKIEKQFNNTYRYSVLLAFSLEKALEQVKSANVLIIDSIGMLSRLYKYASISYIGGGYTKDGIHNILEAAVFGKPVLFGPNYKKYREAKELLNAGGAFNIITSEDLQEKITELLNGPFLLELIGAHSKNYVLKNTGTTERILQFIQEKRLLTR